MYMIFTRNVLCKASRSSSVYADELVIIRTKRIDSICSMSSSYRLIIQKEPPAPRPSSANYLRAHSRTGFIPQSARAASTEPPPEKLTIPKAQTAREVSTAVLIN